MKTVAVLLFYIAVLLPETIVLKRKNKTKEMAVFLSMMFIALTLTLLIINGVDVPSIDKIVGDWILEGG